MNIRLILSGLAASAALCAISGTARAQIYVANVANGAVGAGTIAEYTNSGALVSPALISGLSYPQGIAVSGDKLFVANLLTGTISEFTTSGAVVNLALVPGLNAPGAIAVFGADLYVA